PQQPGVVGWRSIPTLPGAIRGPGPPGNGPFARGSAPGHETRRSTNQSTSDIVATVLLLRFRAAHFPGETARRATLFLCQKQNIVPWAISTASGAPGKFAPA